MDLNKLKKTIEHYSVVSFDVFDTLVKRDVVTPLDVFRLLGERVSDWNEDIAADDFYLCRLEAERKARQNAQGEVSLNEIYGYMPYGSKINERIKEEEERLEITLCQPNYDIVQSFQYALSNCEKVYIISDMYLSRAVIEQILFKCGVKGYAALYVSCEEHTSKRIGGLFRLIRKKENIKRTWLHIGDSWKADYLMPKLLGIDCFHIKRDTGRMRNSYLDAFINNRLPSLRSYEEKVGFSIYGPVLYFFTNWLNERVKQKKICTVMFFARDGYLLKKAFDVIKSCDIKSAYFLVSRRSLVLPSICFCETFENFYYTVLDGFPFSFTVDYLLEVMEIDAEDIPQIMDISGYKTDDILNRDSLLTEKKFQDLFNIIKPRSLKKGKIQCEALKKYLTIFGMDNGKIAVVDVGWRGSLQKILQHILHKELYGFYFGVDKAKFSLKQSEGCFANDVRDIDKWYGFSGLTEMVFSAPHGSVLRFEKNHNAVRICYRPYEYRNMVEHDRLNKIREGALIFFKKMDESPLRHRLASSPEMAQKNIFRAGNEPTCDIVNYFGEFRYCDDGLYLLASPKRISDYMVGRGNIKHDFIKSRWKIGFLKRLFRLPLPYNIIYCWLRIFQRGKQGR